ncbi:MAG: CBS domain-containing protein [Armatimonadota bacterium]|nr:CBS domain-containing protein [Armatimonadota bacterium]
MKTVEQVMTRDVVTIGAGRTVAEAIALMLDREVGVLPVIEDHRLVGLITIRDLLRALPYRPVSEVMPRDLVTAAPEMLITTAYALMEERRLAQLPVVEQDRLVGLITREDILRALGRPVDPLTDLPWVVTLRERAVELLKQGHEIAIIFLDLDNFGLVNKRLGHVVGDQYIRAAAQALGRTIDRSKDLLCRYGGDEFVILTTRPRTDAEDLGRQAARAVAQARPEGATDEFVLSASTGIAGGKRTTERHDIHFAATVDDLITMASLQSTEAKIEKARSLPYLGELRPAAQPRLQLRRVSLTAQGPEAAAVVELGLGDARYLGEARGPNLGTVPLRSVAEATLRAVTQALRGGWMAAVDDVYLVRTSAETLVAVTVLLGKAGLPPERHTGTAVADADPGSATARATLHAINRRLGKILSG